MKNCKFCGRKAMNDPSDYYHRKECESEHVLNLIKNKQYSSQAELHRLEKQLELARYVGD